MRIVESAVGNITDPNEPNALIILGEIRGQLRELIHNANNNSQKLDALAVRVSALEQDKSRRDGAMGLFEWFLKNWPAVLGFGVLMAVVLRANGKLP